MAKWQLRDVSQVKTWRLENQSAAVDIERDTGLIRSMIWKKKGLDLFAQVRGGIPGYAGGLRIYDEHDRRWYSDLETPFETTKAAKRGQSVRFSRQYKGAPWSVSLELRMEDDALHWEVRIDKAKPQVKDRSLRVYFFLPLIAGWDVWAPCNFGETTFDGMTPFEFMYTQIPYVSDQEIILPMVSHYHRKLGVGFSVVEPIDANVPAAKFCFNNADKCFNWGTMHKDARDVPVLEAVNYCIGLVGDRPLKTKVMVFFHDGDWRCGLGQVYRRWQSFFDPFNDAIYEREGVFICGGIQNAADIEGLLAMGVKTMEVHGHFEDYCDYFQDGKDSWLTIGTKETVRRKLMEKQGVAPALTVGEKVSDPLAWQMQEFVSTHTDQEIADFIGQPVESVRHHRSHVKECLQKLEDAGIRTHWYFNYTDGLRPRVEAQWPDSIVKDEDGKYVPSGWYMCHNLNADPRWSFGKFCYESSRRIFDAYPMLHGYFLDCFRHYEIDFAHDDGVTVVNGKPCYSINRSYDDIERLIKTDIFKPRNLTSFANKPMSIRSMLYCDGQLLEGNGDMYEEKFFWASIAMPMFYMWTSGEVPLDECLRRAVLHGCYPRNSELTAENIALYQKYLPLYAQFGRRVFCFEPDPIRPPHDSRGKLYTLADGYVAGLMSTHVSDRDQVKYARTPYALFRVERGCDVGRAGVMYPGDRELRDVKFKFDGTFIAVALPDYKNCAVVKLFVTGKSGKKIGPDMFAMRPRMCGDPDSAFEDISVR